MSWELPDPRRDEDDLAALWPLQPSQLRILQAAASGLRTGEIAVAFGLPPHTVKDELKGARRSLAAKTTAQAVAIALRRGLIQ